MKTRLTIKTTLFIGILLFSFSGLAQKTASSNTYDLVILNGRVMDPETMYDKIANVGIQDGHIAIITTEKIEGKRTINASGLVVAPGFIDTHLHANDPFGSKMALRDGTTTGIDMEAGAYDVAGWYDEKAKTGWPLNYGATSSLLFNRLKIHDPEVDMTKPADFVRSPELAAEAAKDGVAGWATQRSSLEQMNQVMRQIDEDLRQGALGVGASLAYQAIGAESYEVYEAQRTAARYGRVTSVHTRYHMQSQTPEEATISLDEMLVNAMLLDAPLLLSHDNDYGWWENEDKLKRARDKGYNVWAEYYPYDIASTVVSASFLQPDQWETVQGYKYEETIYDPLADKWLDKAAFLDLVKKAPGQSVIIKMPYRTPWMKYWLTIPHMTVATDGMPGVGMDGKLLPWDADFSEYSGHPRVAGGMAKVLRMGRENDVPLMFTLSQLSYWSAKHLGDAGLQAMKDRGRVQVGKVADLTLFDPITVTDNATSKVKENGLPSTGIPYVIVNGTVVVDNNVVLPVKPGQAIRYPIEAKGRFEPIEKEKRIGEFSINVGRIPVDDTGASALKAPPSEVKKSADKNNTNNK
ncbi:N-acyl-D-glutamate deacylase [Algoriphagus boseongensis]|uniref:N-acyl-D-glutamate deacylase n=1 Tax=Algoriphagus boseongensis TaxID=1442587 RepID=A0A4R6TAR0_9BACT|nr:amidohydrolase family protein [Algoriphagus boseongensis]TDQ19289.1 N-acyl-D-glutamate deacylase [Algoriphagus boseongensis]